MIHYIDVPHYSQFQDIPAVVAGLTPKNWQKEGCGIAAMAMEIEFFKPEANVSVPKLLTQAVVSGAYVSNVGWSHTELAALAAKYGLVGKTLNFTELSNVSALEQLKETLKGGPVIASVYNKFDPVKYRNLGHLVVVTGYDGDSIFYNDPAVRDKVESKISYAGFLNGWKKRLIAVRVPITEIAKVAPVEPAPRPEEIRTPEEIVASSARYSPFIASNLDIIDSLFLPQVL